MDADRYAAVELRTSASGVCLGVHVKPRASRRGIVGVRGTALDVAVHAAPEDGKANAEVRAVIGEALDVPLRDVDIVSGAKARTKVVAIRGLDEASVRERLRGVA